MLYRVYLGNPPPLENIPYNGQAKGPLAVIGERRAEVICQLILCIWQVGNLKVDQLGNAELLQMSCL